MLKKYLFLSIANLLVNEEVIMKKNVLSILTLAVIIATASSLNVQAQETAQQPLSCFPTQINSQITDSVTQVNTKVLGDAPAMALGNLYQATAQALSNAAHNATTAQQQATITSQAATTMGVSTLYSIDTATDGVSTTNILNH